MPYKKNHNISDAVISNLLLYRTCVHGLNYTESECSAFLLLNTHNETQSLEKDVQEYATFVITVKGVLESVTPAILSMFLGVWSDTHGRKPLIVWPLFGKFPFRSYTALSLYKYVYIHVYGNKYYILLNYRYCSKV